MSVAQLLSPDAIEKYCLRRQEDLEAFRKALLSKDFEVIERIGHKLKGNGHTFGFPELSVLGEQTERAAQAKDLLLSQDHYIQLKAWVLENARKYARPSSRDLL